MLAFNRGEVSKLALQRVDVEKLRLAAACQLNWLPYVQGPMMLRPGLLAVGRVLNDAPSRIIPFIFAKLDTALLELTDSEMRVWLVSGSTETLLSRVAVSTTVDHGDFSATGSWVLNATAGCSAVISSNQLVLSPTARGGVTTGTQHLTVAAGDQGKEHALRIKVVRGPVAFRAGTTSGADNYIGYTALDTGTHSLAFTPTGADVYVQFEASSTAGPTCQPRIIGSCQIEGAGVVSVPTNWLAGDLDNVRFDQSGDIIFCAAYGKRQQKIERRSARSWSVVDYYANNGPFDTAPFSDAKLSLSLADGTGTLHADKAAFAPEHVGALFRVFTPSQVNTWTIGGEDAYTDAVRVTGVQADRAVSVTIAGTWAGTVYAQRSYVGPDSGFVDCGVRSVNDTFTLDGVTTAGVGPYDNQIIWYRVGFKLGSYTSGNAQITMSYAGGGRAGICRVIGYTDPQNVTVEVITPVSAANVVTSDWQMGLWADPAVAGWPTSCCFHEGRLWWFGPDVYGSESDGYYSFRTADGEGNPIGDAGAIITRFGSGPVDTVSWGLSLTRLLCGREQSIASVRSSNFDQPLTAAAIVVRDCSDQGAQRLPAVKIGKRGIFVQQSGRKVYELAFQSGELDYGDRDLTRLNLDIGLQGFVDISNSAQPDEMLWLPRGDGQAAALLYDVDDDVVAWWRLQTLGVVEKVAVLPAAGIEETVYFVVKRTVNGVTRRFIEKLALRGDCVGGALNKQLDCAIVYSGAAVSTLQHPYLPGTTIRVWADGADIGTATTDVSGNFTMPDGQTHSNVVAGLAGAVVSDSFTNPSTTLSVGAQYNGYPCEVFADIGGTGRIKRVGALTVSGGLVTLPNGASATSIYAYFGYVAPFYSAKLAYSVPGASPINVRKKLDALGLILYDTAANGLQYGQTPAQLDELPLVEAEMTVAAGTVWSEYEEPVTTLPGEWDTDSRLMLLAQAPNPCTVGAVTVQAQTG